MEGMDSRVLEFIVLSVAAGVGAGITAYISVMVSASRLSAQIGQLQDSVSSLDRRIMRLENLVMSRKGST